MESHKNPSMICCAPKSKGIAAKGYALGTFAFLREIVPKPVSTTPALKLAVAEKHMGLYFGDSFQLFLSSNFFADKMKGIIISVNDFPRVYCSLMGPETIVPVNLFSGKYVNLADVSNKFETTISDHCLLLSHSFTITEL